MRYFAKTAVVLAAAVLFACPVFATERSDAAEKTMLNDHSASVEASVSDLEKTQVGDDSIVSFKIHEDTVREQLNAYNRSEYDNYILYLKRVVVNDQETVRIKQQNVDSLTDLCNVNPGMAVQLEAAQKELKEAQAVLAEDQAEVSYAIRNNSYLSNK